MEWPWLQIILNAVYSDRCIQNFRLAAEDNSKLSDSFASLLLLRPATPNRVESQKATDRIDLYFNLS